MKDQLTGFLQWVAAVLLLLVLLYVLPSPLIFQNVTTPGVTRSRLMLWLSGPVIHVLESDFKGPVLWYFGLWGIGIDYFARDPAPPVHWYVSPVYVSLGLALAALLARTRGQGCPRSGRGTGKP
jgi:hypothetical protein